VSPPPLPNICSSTCRTLAVQSTPPLGIQSLCSCLLVPGLLGSAHAALGPRLPSPQGTSRPRVTSTLHLVAPTWSSGVQLGNCVCVFVCRRRRRLLTPCTVIGPPSPTSSRSTTILGIVDPYDLGMETPLRAPPAAETSVAWSQSWFTRGGRRCA
jgi:hypothetical protein